MFGRSWSDGAGEETRSELLGLDHERGTVTVAERLAINMVWVVVG